MEEITATSGQAPGLLDNPGSTFMTDALLNRPISLRSTTDYAKPYNDSLMTAEEVTSL